MSTPTTDPWGLHRSGLTGRGGRRLLVPSRVLTGLFVLAVLYTLYFARGFLLPVVLALFAAALLRPAVHALERLHIRPALGAGIVLILLLAGIGFGLYRLSSPAAQWIDKAPELLDRVESRIGHLKVPVAQVSEATERLDRLTDMSGRGPRVVALEEPGMGEALVTVTAEVIAAFVVMVVLAWFILASGDLFLRKAVHMAQSLSTKKRLVEVVRLAERDISRYLVTITLINIGLGVAVGSALWLLGLPNPALWGALATVLNFIPYLGALVMVTIVGVVSLLAFESAGYALLVTVIYLAITSTEGYLVTPMLLGRRLSLNPVVIFAGLVFWGWIWGITGALLAVPLLMVVKIGFDHTRGLERVGELMGR